VDADVGSVADRGTPKGSVNRTGVQELDAGEAHNHLGISDPESGGQTRPFLLHHGGYLTKDKISTNRVEVASNTHHYKVFSC